VDNQTEQHKNEQRLKLTIAYNGARFKGWQKGNGRTVQDTLIAAIQRALPDTPDIRVDGAGRTDAGVHALGQVASVVVPRQVDREQLLLRVNRYLPDDIAVRTIERADDRFEDHELRQRQRRK
jgi:tRNA pseudouridine38-40 synthase